jgi:electron transport complex protein RnfE
MGRVEGFASKRPLSDVIPDALGMGLGYTWVLVGIAAVRELLGGGTILSFRLIPEAYNIVFFVLPPGGFLVFALFISLNLFLRSRLRTGEGPLEGGGGATGCAGHQGGMA